MKIGPILLLSIGLSMFATGTWADLSSGLVAHYEMNANPFDSSGLEHHAASLGATLTDDRFGNPNSAYQFDGVNDALITGTNDDLNPESAITLSAWIYLDAYPSGYMSVINKFNSYILQFNSGQGLVLVIFEDGYSKGVWQTIPVQNQFELNRWYHIAGSFDETTGVAALYIDGVSMPVYANGRGYPTSINASDNNLLIGSENGTQWFSGRMDDVRIYNRALSDDEVISMYNELPTPPNMETQPMALQLDALRFDKTSGSISIQAHLDANDARLDAILVNPLARMTLDFQSANGDVPEFGVAAFVEVPLTSVENSLQYGDDSQVDDSQCQTENTDRENPRQHVKQYIRAWKQEKSDRHGHKHAQKYEQKHHKAAHKR